MSEAPDKTALDKASIPPVLSTREKMLKKYEAYHRGEIDVLELRSRDGNLFVSWDELMEFEDWELKWIDNIDQEIRRKKLERLETRRQREKRRRERMRYTVSRRQPCEA